MGAGVMNSDYTSEELLSLTESSDDGGIDDSCSEGHGEGDHRQDIQNAVHEKYVVNISAGKASRAKERAQEFVDGAFTKQYNQLWDYCAELKRSSPGSTVLMKNHTFNKGDLAAEIDLHTRVPYFERL
ncbi:hypothetical protein SO802_003562 [Lithocarpus litseifolius]|uniref:Uncharacterized protein n=1 Tax=Lithocarpus litseifolius TaxID=425828 RepID=A0AAW2E4B8_9ROSI